MKHILNYKNFLLNENKKQISWTSVAEILLSSFNDDRIADKLSSLFMKHILNVLYPQYKDDLPDGIKSKYNSLNSYDRVSYLCKHYDNIIIENFENQLGSINDFLSDDNTDINIVRTIRNFSELYDLSVIYHENLDVVYKDVRTDETEKTDVFITYPDGWYWINLNTSHSIDEANNMGHCGKDAGKILFSLRDDKKQSHITASYSIEEKALYQIKGRNNSKPKKIYHEKIVDMITNNKYEVKFLKNATYRPDLDFNLQDLSENMTKEIIRRKPSLLFSDKMFRDYFNSRDYLGLLSMVNNGYEGYNGSDGVSLYHTENQLFLFKRDCAELEIDYMKLVKYCFRISQTTIRESVENIDFLKTLIDAGVNTQSGDNFAMRCASSSGSVDIVKLLIENGADVTACDSISIVFASDAGNIDVVKLILENGADVTTRNNEAIRTAIYRGHTDVVKLLIENGADITADYKDGLEEAVKMEKVEIIKMLIDSGVDLTYSNNFVWRRASHTNNTEILELLINAGIDVSVCNNYAIKYAIETKRSDVVEFLKKHGAVL